ncbi:metallophosphoesterase family protein [Thermosulfurimonas dismutans]|uniref:RNA lariat debranching enzyme n=1 Tax=Thermosulfurimonas dismutans TaxID=999894 RepID=A0A179D496_9BACT|nr:metallophosphoesterase [Thermosulfurimonas dismutans]OAQ20302.1 RNA lariat debranching enzyme [Thermosulfurimonas dismutans]
MHFAVIGDVHGRFELLARVLAVLRDRYGVELAFQVGDLAFLSSSDPKYLKALKMAGPQTPPLIYDVFDDEVQAIRFLHGDIELPVPVYFVGGNHEDWPYLDFVEEKMREQGIAPPYEIAPNLFFLGKASVVEVSEMRVVTLSGIYDRLKWELCVTSPRKLYYHNQEDEEALLFHAPGADLFIAHEWPVKLASGATWEEAIYAAVGSPTVDRLIHHFRPALSFHGHMHRYAQGIRGPMGERPTKWVGLDMLIVDHYHRVRNVALCEFEGPGAVRLLFTAEARKLLKDASA